MNYAEFKQRDPALANAIAELVGDFGPDYYRGFIRAINIIQKDVDIGIHRLEEYKAYCQFKLGEGEEVPITELVVKTNSWTAPDIPYTVDYSPPKKRGRPRKFGIED